MTTTPSKYIDLGPQVAKGTGGLALTSLGHQWQLKALKWLDEHPELTGKTITESEYRHAMLAATDTEDFDAEELLRRLGLTVIPDPEPEPTNAEKWVKFCSSKLGLDLDPWQANALDKAGVKAPGGESDE